MRKPEPQHDEAEGGSCKTEKFKVMCVLTNVNRDEGHNGNSEGAPETLQSLSSRGVRRNYRVPDCQKRVKTS